MSRTRTKIIATIGPASQAPATLERMLRAGMHSARLNFSHGTYASHKKLLRAIRSASLKAKRPVVILADLQGPKIRLGELEKPLKVKKGEVVELPVGFPKFGRFLKKGDALLLDDGRVLATYQSGKGDTITVRVTQGGELLSHAGLAAPGARMPGVSSLTPKDKEDATFAMGQHVDWLVQSFVTTSSDVVALRRFVKRTADPGFEPKIMVKIERAEAVKNAKAIIKVADGVMIGRGDLGLDLPIEQVPVAQKTLVQLCREAGKPVVVATQMLESMMTNARPTRAEVSDIANAVVDHADAVMLSGETAKGAYPLECVEMMHRVILETEASVFDNVPPKPVSKRPTKEQAFALMMAELVFAGRVEQIAVRATDRMLLQAIVWHRPEVSLFVVDANSAVLRQSLLEWGVEPVRMSVAVMERGAKVIAETLRKERQVKRGSTVTVVGYEGSDPTFQTIRV